MLAPGNKDFIFISYRQFAVRQFIKRFSDMKKAVALIFIATIYFSIRVSAFPANAPVIVRTKDPNGWIIRTKSSVYQLILTKNDKVEEVFYGPSAQLSFKQRNALWINGMDEVPVRGAFPVKTPLLEVVFADHVRDADLKFVDAAILSIAGRQTLKITQKDTYYPLEVTSYIRVIPEYDILEKWVVVKNTGKKDPIKVENLQSASISLPNNVYDLTHMAGEAGHEFQLRTTRITEGIKTLEARDFKSFLNSNWFVVRPADEKEDTLGSAWFGSLEYSGNWRIDFDKAYDGRLQIVGGINFWDTDWYLKPGEELRSPKFIVGYTQSGIEGASRDLRKYVRNQVLPEEFRHKLRPVLFNSWYATTFSVNEKQQLALAKVAKELGVELFVIDDGWFKGRSNDHAALGDWTVDKKKFPNGLQHLIKQINDMGMDFGIWVEPEMVSPNSDLYRKHPDWVFYFPNRTRHEGRHQLMLNLAREDVYQYLLKSLSKLLSDNNIKYLKWDQNRTLSEPGWPSAPVDEQREVRIRYIHNLYRLIDSLRSRFPDVLFEDCSSGGGRVDLGMLSRMDQAWVSDNTDPIDRILIQYGYLNAFPANTMVSWITPGDHHHSNPSLEFKFDVAMSGVLGIGYDITKWNKAEIELAKKKIALYKKIRPLVQEGTLFRLTAPYSGDKCALQYVSNDRSSAVVFCYNMAEYLQGSTEENQKSRVLRLQGLDPNASYKILPDRDQRVYKGNFLMKIGIAWPVSGIERSAILEVKRLTE
jgi:alpha-galactosidase